MARLSILSIALLVLTAHGNISEAATAAGLHVFQTQVKELHQVKLLLERANHDYKGHRAAAVREITKAIHTLQAGTAPNKTATSHPHGKGHEPQALSDAQLRGAIQALATVSQQLHAAASKNTRAAKATKEVQLAMKQLTLALKVR